MAETQTTSLDQTMQSYIDSGHYSESELAEIRKREANKLKESTRETSWWKGEEGFIPDELQSSVNRPRVAKEEEPTKKTLGFEEYEAAKKAEKEIDKNKTQEERVEKYGGKVDTKVEVDKPGRGSQTIYSKHEGLDDVLQTLDATEEEYVPALNKFYEEKGVDVRFVEANPVWTDWLNVGSSWNSIEVLIGDQKEGEGFKIPMYDKGSSSKFGESVSSLNEITSKIRSHIDENMGDQHYELDNSIAKTKNNEGLYDELSEIFSTNDLVLDDNQTNRARFANKGDIVTGDNSFVPKDRGLLTLPDEVDVKEGTGLRLQQNAGLKGVLGAPQELFTLGNYDSYTADMSGGVTLKDGTFVSYEYIFDKRKDILAHRLSKDDSNLTKEKIESFGSEEEYNNYLEDNSWVYFNDDEQEYYKLKRELENVKSGRSEGDEEAIVGRLEQIADEKEWKVLYDENGSYLDIKKSAPEEGSQEEAIEQNAGKLAKDYDKTTLEKLRQQSAIRLENLAKLASGNSGQILEEMQGSVPSEVSNIIGGWFDFSGDSYDDDMKSLNQIAESGDLFGSDKALTNLPGGSDLQRAFDDELLKFKTLSRAHDLNINVAQNVEENTFLEIADNLSRAFTGEDVFGTIEDEARDSFEAVLEQEGYDVERFGESEEEFGANRHTWESITEIGTDLAPLLTELYLLKKVGGTAKIHSGVKKLTNIFTKHPKTSKSWAKVIDKFVVPAVATPIEWSIGEVVGEHAFGDMGGVNSTGEDSFKAHTVNLETGETNFTMPVVMGLMGPAWQTLSGRMYSKVANTAVGKHILPKVMNPEGLMHGTRKGVGKMLAQGSTGSAMLLVAESVQAAVDEAAHGGNIDGLVEKLNETWTIEHFINTAAALSILSAGKVHPSWKDAFKRDVAHLKGETVESNKAAKELKVKKDKEGYYEQDAIEKALNKKVEEIEKDNTLDAEAKKEKIEEAKVNRKHLELFNEVKNFKKDYQKPDSKTGKNRMAEYNRMQWEAFENLKKDLTSSGKDYDAIAKMKPWKVEELLRRNGIDIGSAQGKWYMNTRDYISHLTQLANLIGYKKTDSTRNDYIKDTLSIERNKSRIEEIEKSIKDGKGGESLGAELRSLKETNKKLYEANDIRFKKYQTKWNSLLKAEISAAKNLAGKLGASVKQYNATQWSKLKGKDGKPLDPEADASYEGSVLRLNMRVLRLRKNLGAPVHEVVHHILRNSFKHKSGSKKGLMTEEGMNVIDQLVDKFTLQEQKIIQKRIDDNYRYQENLDGSFRTYPKGHEKAGEKIERKKEEYYEEYITSISDAIKNGDIKFNVSTMRKAGKLVYPWLKNIGMSNLYKYDLNGSKSTKAAQDLYNLLGDVSAAKQVRAETIEGLRELAGDKAGLHPNAVSSKSKDIYQNERVSENLGITKKSTKEIIEKNREIENKIVEENIRDVDGNLQASTRNQQRLVENNMAASFKLALEAANKAKHITLEEGLKYDDVNEWFSEYNMKLVDLARTYRAERVWDKKTNKPISPPEKVPFGAYMGGLLPKKYSGILEAGKAKIEAKSMSDANVAKQVGKMTAASNPSAFETNGRTIKVAERLGPQGKRIKNMVMSTVNLIGAKPYSVKDGKKIDLTKATFKSLKNVVLKEVQKEVFGIDPKTGNLSKPDIKSAQMVISKHADMFKTMLPEHHTTKRVNTGTKENPIWETRPDKATGIENVLLEAFYDKGVRKDNLTPWTKKKNIKTSDFLEVFGIMERGVPNSYKKDSNTSSRIHAMVKQVERMMVNQSVREKLKEMGFGKEEWFSVVAEGRSEGYYSKSVYRNENVAESTVKDFDYKKRAFHREIGLQGLTPQAIRRAYDITYGKDGLQDVYGASLKAKVVDDYKAFLKPYVAKMGSYTVNKEKFPVDVAEYLASVSIPDAAQAVARMMGVKKSMVELFRDPKQKERYQEFNTDMLSERIERKIEEIVDSKEIQRIKDKTIADEIRGKSHLENGSNNPTRSMAFYKVDGFIQNHLSKIPGYENLINYKKGGGTKKEPGRYIELEFGEVKGAKNNKKRKIKLPESAEFDGKQKTTQEMVDDNVSKREMDLRKENAQFHWDRVNEILDGASELVKGEKYGKEEVSMLLAGLLGNMKTSLRSAALFKYAPVNPPTRELTRKVRNKEGKLVDKKNFEYEHGIPAKDITVILAGHHFFGKKVDLQKLKDSYSVGVVHVDFNKNFGEVFQDRMQFDYKIGDIPPKRWFNEWTAMGEAHAMKDIYTGEVYGEAQVNYWSKVKENHKKSIKQDNKVLQDLIGPNYSKSSKRETLKDLETIDKAVKLGRDPNKKNKGMSTWDFDDTLATTKSGVRATIPNPSGKPKPSRKVIFLAGGAGSGKGNVIKKLNLEKQGFKLVNSDISLEWLKKNNGLPENMNDLTKEQRSALGSLQHQARGIAKRKMMKYKGNADGVVVDGTGGSIKSMEKLVNEFKDKGYDVSMLFVETSLNTALARNRARAERSLLDKIVEKNHEAVQGNKDGFKTMFGERFMEVKTDKLKQEDAMPTDLVNKMNDFVSGYEKVRLDAEQFATEGKGILDKGGKFDFSEFNVVTEGAQGPFFQKALARAKKYGTKDQFVLTARPAESAIPIYEFLKSQGLEIPLKNITGLGNSTGEAKAMWMLEKFKEGYNDMYFADDAMQNVEAVKNVLEQLDVKSKVQQAVRYSRTRPKLSKTFNDILEEVKGIKSEKTYSEAKAKLFGSEVGKKWFGTPGMEDFAGLVTYAFAGKGKRGEAHIKFFEENLQRPFNRAYNEIHSKKQSIGNDYKALRKSMPEVRKSLENKVDGIYNVDQAVRVYNWNKAGFKVPGLSKADLKKLVNHVESKPELVLFADQLSKITMLPEGYLKPGENWLGENITMDMNNVVERVYRKEALAEFRENREAIFGKWEGGRIVGENMSKIEAAYGPKHREALENMLWRMENGTNRTVGADSNTNKWMNWVNDATGTIMFFNQKSAVLQTISSLNYVNGSFNNPLRAAQAFANQPQYWKDFAMIFKSDMLVQRRDGLKINIEAAELLERVGNKKGGFARFRKYLLEKGFIPTKYADSFAIASGGATYYRNSVRKYKKQGMSEKQAEKKAWEDFMQMTEATQQSSRPDLISMQQASALGRPILAFANTPMQMFRRHKRRIQDIANRRGNTVQNVGSALYYGLAQTMIFSFLSNAMFAVDDESDDPDKVRHAEKQKGRYTQTIVDSYLRGMGTGGAAVSALKNGILSFFKESEKVNPDYANTVIDMLNVSPPIGSKARKLYSAGRSYKYDRDIIPEMGFRIDNPAVLAVANVISATTNLPADRVVMKLLNIKDASNSDFETWQRIAMSMGVGKWTLGVKDEKLEAEMDAIEKRVKKSKKKEKKQKEDVSKIEVNKKKQAQERKQGKTVTCAAVSKSGNRCKTKVESGSSYCTIHAKVKQNKSGKKTQCRKTKSNGKRCKMQTSASSGYCYYHD